MVVTKMSMSTTFPLLSSSIFLRTWTRKCTKNLTLTLNSLVFSYLDCLISVFCVAFKYICKYFKGEASPCGEIGVSVTLHERRKKLENTIDLLGFVGKLLNKKKGFKAGCASFVNQKKACVHRWFYRGCDPCISCMKINDPKLRIVAKVAKEAHYLDACSICGKSLHKSDIFMYRGNVPFCSNECRQEQMEIDEERENELRFDKSLRKSDYKSFMPSKIVPTRIIRVS